MDNEDVRRELLKAREVLCAVELHLARHAEMNAALHCSEKVMYSPLHSRVTHAVHDLDQTVEKLT